MKYFVEKSGSKIVAKGCISEDVPLAENQKAGILTMDNVPESRKAEVQALLGE